MAPSASASASGSPGGTSRPVLSSTISGMPAAVSQTCARDDEVGEALLLDEPADGDDGEGITSVRPAAAERIRIDAAGNHHDSSQARPPAFQVPPVVITNRDGGSCPPELPVQVEGADEDVERVCGKGEPASESRG